jgi:hypothetical protein
MYHADLSDCKKAGKNKPIGLFLIIQENEGPFMDKYGLGHHLNLKINV